MRYLLSSMLVLCFVVSNGQQASIERIRTYRSANEGAIFKDFFSLLMIPNVATDTEHIAMNAGFLVDLMKRKGIEHVQLLQAGEKNVPPVVYGEVNVPGATKTVIFYAHYDGQPVNPPLWSAGLHPFRPQLLNGRVDQGATIQKAETLSSLPDDWRIYARGASDDKAGVMAIISAVDAIKQTGLKLSSNIKFFFEGEEEQGSPHLAEFIAQYKSLLSSDLWIICDGPVHQSGRKQVVFGARGDAHLTLRVYGPKNPLHSGHYGNWVPNPVMTLVKLLATMKDERGRVTVKDFYSDVKPLTAAEEKALAEIPEVDADLKKRIGFYQEEMPGTKLAEAINLPSLNINGIESSNVGTIQANVIPISATAVLDLRLVLGNDWQKQQQKVIEHIKAQGFYVTEKEPTDEERSKYQKIVQVKRGAGDNAQRTDMDWPIAKKVVDAVQQTTIDPVLRVPTLGGSLPVNTLEKLLGARSLIVPIANPDNNQHAEDENIRLRNFRDGIDIMAAIMLIKL
jgi:acetylornithine deacetylase/succinyl-diaminopimelate desuccinylase-like protein